MINRKDEQAMRKLVSEMNLGFSVPQNGGVSSQPVVILKQNQDPTDVEDASISETDVGALLSDALSTLEQIKLESDQTQLNETHMTQLQHCVDQINSIISQIQNGPVGSMNGAFTGLGHQSTGEGRDAAQALDFSF